MRNAKANGAVVLVIFISSVVSLVSPKASFALVPLLPPPGLVLEAKGAAEGEAKGPEAEPKEKTPPDSKVVVAKAPAKAAKAAKAAAVKPAAAPKPATPANPAAAPAPALLKAVVSRAAAPAPEPPVASPAAAEPPAAEPAAAQETFTIFSGPSEVPVGESWILVGSLADLPADLAASSLTAGVAVLETRKTAKSLRVRVSVAAGSAGTFLRLYSPALNQEAVAPTVVGGIVPPLTTARSFAATDLVDGNLVLPGKFFLYGYLEASEKPLWALRIYNRETGLWHRHELGEKRAQEAAELAARPLDPALLEADTDGDGILDIDEPEVVEERPKQLGILLDRGLNVLDIFAQDDDGNASWSVLGAFSEQPPESAEF